MVGMNPKLSIRLPMRLQFTRYLKNWAEICQFLSLELIELYQRLSKLRWIKRRQGSQLTSTTDQFD